VYTDQINIFYWYMQIEMSNQGLHKFHKYV